MGRWAQRARGGGVTQPLVTGATFTVSMWDGTTANLDYTLPLDTSPLVAADFHLNNSHKNGIAATPLAPGSVGIDFSGFNPGDTKISYNGSVIDFESPWVADLPPI